MAAELTSPEEPPRETAPKSAPNSALEAAPESSDDSSLPRTVKLLGWTSFLNDTASEILYPLLPAFLAGTLHAGAMTLGVLEGLAESVASLVKLWSGGRSDQSPRRKWFVLSGYIVTSIARPLTALAALPWHVVATRTADRIGKGIRSAPRDAMIADATSPNLRGRAFGFNRAMDHAGAVVGPMIAATFLYWRPDDYRTLFLLTAIPGAMLVLLLLFALREAPRPQAAKQPFRLTLAPLGRDFRLYLVALAIFTLGNSSDLFLLRRGLDLGLRPEAIPLVWGALHVVKSLGSALAGRAVDRFGPRRLIFAGWFVYAVFYVGFAFVTNAWQLVAVLMGYGVFYALTEPAEKTLVASLVPAEQRGLAYGWFNFAIAVTTLPANVAFGWIYGNYGALVAFSSGAALAGVAAALLALVRPRTA